MSYVVVRTHSHTDRQCLWKVLSRNMPNYEDALLWMEHCKNTDERRKRSKESKYMVIEIKNELD